LGRDIAEVYDATYPAEFAPSVLNPIVDLLTELAGQGLALGWGCIQETSHCVRE
jgi:hypothetical protein